MKFTRIHARAFGRLENFDSGSSLLTDLTVVVGPNESGKTTFFNALHSIIFGLYPASKKKHPYAPWSGQDLDLEAEIRLDDGKEWEIHRKMAGSPTARLTRGEAEPVEHLRNQTLPCASHLTREVFQQVFALTLAEVASLESKTWSEIQDRLLGAMGAHDLVPAHIVADAVESEARRLWRPDRRGKQKIRILEKHLRDAKATRRKAHDEDRLLREATRELEHTREALKAACLEKEQHGLLIERITLLLPLRQQTERAAKLEEEAGPSGSLDGIPADPSGEHKRMLEGVATLRTRLRRTQTETEEPRERERAFSANHRAILDARANIEELNSAVAAAGPASSRLSALQQEIRDRERRIASATHEIFERTPTAEEESTVRGLVMHDLHDRVRDAAAARNRIREHSIRRTAESPLPEASHGTLLGGFFAAFAGAALVGWPSAAPWARLLGIALALAAVWAFTRWWTLRQARRDHNPGSGAGPEVDAKIARESEGATAALRTFLSGVPVRPQVLSEAAPDLVATLTRLQESWEELDTRMREIDEAKETLDESASRVGELSRRLGVELPQAGEAAIHVLQTKLREAERAEQASKGARAELDRLKRDEAEIDGELVGQMAALDALERALSELGGGEVEAGIQAATRMRRARETAAGIREDLERSHPDLDDLVARLEDRANSDGGPGGVDALAAARMAEKEFSERIATLTGQVAGLEHTCAQAAARTTADEIDGEIDALKSEVGRLKREHDRKIVLAHAVREADGRFREEHQPDVVRRASGYFATITADRYDDIMVGDAGELEVRRADDDRVLAAGKLSTGTKEQLYLAMRLAALDHLDHDRERLPVFIDEAFVNWDAARRGRGFRLLRELSQTRQVFVMTCHERWAEELIDAGAKRVDLT